MAEVVDIQTDEAEVMAYMDNEGVEMTWLARYQFIERRLKTHPEVNKKVLADQLGLYPTTISRAERVMKCLTPVARDLILKSFQNSSESVEISEISAYRLSDLGDADKEEKALRVVIDRKMTEPEVVRFVAWIKKGGYPSKYPKKGEVTRSTPVGRSGPRFDPNDPNREWWEPTPEWTGMKPDKEGNYDLRGKLDKFGAPYGIYCLLSGMAKYFQRVEKVRNPEAIPDNPFEAKLEELLEKGVREALAQNELEQKEYEAKKSKPVRRASGFAKAAPDKSLAQGDPEKQDRKLASPKPVELEAPHGGPPSEEDMKRLENGVKEVLGEVIKDPKEVMKKLLGDLFNKP